MGQGCGRSRSRKIFHIHAYGLQFGGGPFGGVALRWLMQGERVLRPSRAASLLLVFFEAWELGTCLSVPAPPGRTVVEDEWGPQSTRKHSRKQMRTGCQDGGDGRGGGRGTEWIRACGCQDFGQLPPPGPAQRHVQKLPTQPCDQQRPDEDLTWAGFGGGSRTKPRHRRKRRDTAVPGGHAQVPGAWLPGVVLAAGCQHPRLGWFSCWVGPGGGPGGLGRWSLVPDGEGG